MFSNIDKKTELSIDKRYPITLKKYRWEVRARTTILYSPSEDLKFFETSLSFCPCFKSSYLKF